MDLFKLKNRPQWFTVTNRSKTYVNKILSKISGEYFKNYEINKKLEENQWCSNLLWFRK
jgi:predicted NAD/FAD-binding protein